MKSKLRFLNHASFTVESRQSILVVDPWLEGFAFDQGWALLDQSTSNSELIDYIRDSEKQLFIWYSHEHSDHFAVPFIKALQKRGVPATVYFQETLDGRVAAFIRKSGFTVIETQDTLERLDDEIHLAIWPFHSGDSYSLIVFNEITILNLNDCVIDTEAVALKIKESYTRVCPHIDILFTQFGYANWLGNPEDVELRAQSSDNKIRRIQIQNSVFRPKMIIPFASFVSFCHEDNFYLNDKQNTPKRLLEHNLSQSFAHKLCLMKPGDELSDLSSDALIPNQESVRSAADHWETCFTQAEVESRQVKSFDLGELSALFTAFKAKLTASFSVLPLVLERSGFIRPVTVYIKDLERPVHLSYIRGFREAELAREECDLEMSSDVLSFILRFEYGVSTTLVNGKFRSLHIEGKRRFFRFFSPQDYLKDGWGIKHPVLSTKMFAQKMIGKLLG